VLGYSFDLAAFVLLVVLCAEPSNFIITVLIQLISSGSKAAGV
jgi:hypothetical protein